jgi:hypothetical protein
LSFGRVGGRTVFMDLDSDLYFMAAPEEERDLIASADACAAPLAKASILDQTELPSMRVRDAFSIHIDLIRIRRTLRTRPLAKIVARMESLRGRRAGRDTLDASHVARRFAAARKAVPVSRGCLPDSLALLEWLGRRRIPAMLVFGVKLDPFAAHCWVQRGDLLLTDRIEETERFTPVRSIECAPATR